MSVAHAVQLTWYLQPVLALVGLVILHYRQSLRKHMFFSLFLLAELVEFAVLLPLSKRVFGLLTGTQAYSVYFYSYWSFYLIEAALIFLCIQGMFKQALDPLPGLQKMGLLVFRWATAVSLALAIATSILPGSTSAKFLVSASGELQRGESILILCLLLFLTLAMNPLGLNHRSRIFGVSLGFGIMAVTDLVDAAWISRYNTTTSWVSLLNGASLVLAMLVWITYFAMPEPKRKIITLPLRSPLLRWNDISIALGNPEVHIAIGNGPEMFAPAELEMMTRRSAQVQQTAS